MPFGFSVAVSFYEVSSALFIVPRSLAMPTTTKDEIDPLTSVYSWALNAASFELFDFFFWVVRSLDGEQSIHHPYLGSQRIRIYSGRSVAWSKDYSTG